MKEKQDNLSEVRQSARIAFFLSPVVHVDVSWWILKATAGPEAVCSM